MCVVHGCGRVVYPLPLADSYMAHELLVARNSEYAAKIADGQADAGHAAPHVDDRATVATLAGDGPANAAIAEGLPSSALARMVGRVDGTAS